MLIELLDDPWSLVDDARLDADLASYDLLEDEPDFLDVPTVPVDQRADSVVQIVALVDRLGPCSDAVVLLESLADRELTEDEWLSVTLAWPPVLAWAAGS